MVQSSLKGLCKKKTTYDEQFGLSNNDENESGSSRPIHDTSSTKLKKFKAVHHLSDSLPLDLVIPDVPIKQEDDNKFKIALKRSKNSNKFRVLTNKQNEDQRHMESVPKQNISSEQSELKLVSPGTSTDFSAGTEATPQQTNSIISSNRTEATKLTQSSIDESHALLEPETPRVP